MRGSTEKVKLWIIVVLASICGLAIGGPIGGLFGFFAVIVYGYIIDREAVRKDRE